MLWPQLSPDKWDLLQVVMNIFSHLVMRISISAPYQLLRSEQWQCGPEGALGGERGKAELLTGKSGQLSQGHMTLWGPGGFRFSVAIKA